MIVVSKEIDVLVELGIVYVVVATHSISPFVIVVHSPSSLSVPSVTVMHSD